MSRPRPGVLVAIPLLTLTLAAFLTADPKTTCPIRIGIEASVAAVDGQDGVFRLRAESKDLATGAALSSPQIFFRKGEEGIASSTLPGDGEIRYVIGIDGSTAIFKLETRCNNELMTSQKVTIQLPK